jgi:hypothetical protein
MRVIYRGNEPTMYGLTGIIVHITPISGLLRVWRHTSEYDKQFTWWPEACEPWEKDT